MLYRVRDAKSRLLSAARERATLAAACLKADVPRSEAARLMSEDPEFKLQVEDALSRSFGRAEQTMYDRAVDGWQEPVFYRGERVPVRDPDTGQVVRDDDGEIVYHTTRQVDNSLLQAYLRSVEPGKYGGGGSKVDVGVNVDTVARPMDFEKLTPEELEHLEKLLAKVSG